MIDMIPGYLEFTPSAPKLQIARTCPTYVPMSLGFGHTTPIPYMLADRSRHIKEGKRKGERKGMDLEQQ